MTPARDEPRRLFLALWPEPDVRQALAAIAAPVVRRAGGRPVPAANLHLTLAFIGQTEEPDERFAPLAGLSAAPFELSLERFGCWPGPRVLWLGPRDCPAALAGLVTAVRAWLTRQNIRFDDQEFRPHVTLARKVTVLPEVEPPSPIRWPVRAFALVHSISQPGGPVYRVAQQYPLVANRAGSRHDPNRQ